MSRRALINKAVSAGIYEGAVVDCARAAYQLYSSNNKWKWSDVKATATNHLYINTTSCPLIFVVYHGKVAKLIR